MYLSVALPKDEPISTYHIATIPMMVRKPNHILPANSDPFSLGPDMMSGKIRTQVYIAEPRCIEMQLQHALTRHQRYLPIRSSFKPRCFAIVFECPYLLAHGHIPHTDYVVGRCRYEIAAARKEGDEGNGFVMALQGSDYLPRSSVP